MWLRPSREPMAFSPATFNWLKTVQQRAEAASATFQQKVFQVWKVRFDGRILLCAHTVINCPVSDKKSSLAGEDAPLDRLERVFSTFFSPVLSPRQDIEQLEHQLRRDLTRLSPQASGSLPPPC